MRILIVFLLPVVMSLLTTLASALPWILPRSRKEQVGKIEDEAERTKTHEASLALVGLIPANDESCDLEELFSALENVNINTNLKRYIT